ncbi:sensor histidine kinase [Streptomyces sp. NPDC049813]|uniref:sensor histidine kinase n=1 Tax=Streptomyces sp. NPDC049813 TaxID=3365597 RepID=UPI0037A2DBAA
MQPRRVSTRTTDIMIGLAMTALALLLAWDSPAQDWPAPDAPALALILLANLPAAVRSRYPVVAFLCAQAGLVGLAAGGYWPVVNSLATLLATYTVAALRPARVATAGAVGTATSWLVVGALDQVRGGTHGSFAVAAGQAVVFPAVLWWFGTLARRATDLTRQLKAEQEERARRVLADEQARIARELHDVVAHHLAVISVQSGLARFVFTTDPAAAHRALMTIGDTVSEALEELRRVLTVLRAGTPAPDHPMPGLERLHDLANRVRSTGVRVEVTEAGTPLPLGPGAELCAYRVIQEALTNVIKHAPGADVRITVRWTAHALDLSVQDHGSEAVPAMSHGPGGHGLIGMRQRAKLYGGRVEAGPCPDGGFSVHLVLPAPPRPRVGPDD